VPASGPHPPAGHEHVEALGGTIESIAAAKAGIMKHGRPVVVAHQSHTRAVETLQQAATSLACHLIHAQQQVGGWGVKVLHGSPANERPE